MNETTAPTIINKVAQSALITLNLEDYYPQNPQIIFDIKDYLLHGFVLQEKTFRHELSVHNWQQYAQCNVGVHCSTDAIVPTWAYMLVATYLQGVAQNICFGNAEQLVVYLYEKTLQAVDYKQFEGKRVVVKGCGDIAVPAAAYLYVAAALKPYAKSIMYGEPCSTVPIFKQ
jgi:hypothetical protein